MYWGRWIKLHHRRKKELLQGQQSGWRVGAGMALLGFSAFYREGFEVVLFLQTYRLKLGEDVVLLGALVGFALTAVIAVFTFVAHRRLPYRKMLILTGVLLGAVLLVMVGEQAQEMQLAHWLPTTFIPALKPLMPDWTGLWFGITPTVETLAAQALAATLVIGSYFAARRMAGGEAA